MINAFFLSCVRLAAPALAALGLLLPGAAMAQMRALSDTEMSSVSGQGLFSVSNSSYGGFDFTRISLDADVTLNANLANLRLGEYGYAPRNGLGADLDISAWCRSPIHTSNLSIAIWEASAAPPASAKWSACASASTASPATSA
jgi:hypothetical protein